LYLFFAIVFSYEVSEDWHNASHTKLFHKSNYKWTDKEAATAPKCIAFVDSIVELIERLSPSRCPKCNSTIVLDWRFIGSCLHVEWHCPSFPKHFHQRWSSQPRLYGLYAGNILLPTCIAISGNSYKKIALMMKFLNLGSVTKRYMLQ
jgi:DNA-directed RNA polymerase subunit RPC12/RpoP